MSRRVVIIGSGLGGLSCGVVMAQNGYDVTVLEQGTQYGGCLQCFSRGSARFETGMHFVGQAREGQTLHTLLRFLGVDGDMRFSALDTAGYDVVHLQGQAFGFACGREAFIEGLAAHFPTQKDGLAGYCHAIDQVARASSIHSMCDSAVSSVSFDYQLKPIDAVIGQFITDPLLAKVLVGNLPLYAAQRGKTPFSTHAFIMNFYNAGAYRFVGGSDQLAHALHHRIVSMGGRVLTGTPVVAIGCDGSRATGVRTAAGDSIPADVVISTIHPQRTLELLDTPLIRQAYRRRVMDIPNTVGTFTLYIEFKDQAMPYSNSNHYWYAQDSPWDCEQYDDATWPKGYLYMHMCHEPHPQWAHTAVVISYMQMAEVAPWADTTVGHRGADYKAFKQRKAEALLDAMERDMPGFRSKVRRVYTSTPITYRDYTGTVGGSLYGLARDVTLGAAGRVSHRTRIPNLLLAGQNINSHGILGVLVGTLVACAELLGSKTLYSQITTSATHG